MRIQGRVEIPENLRKFLVNPTPKVDATMKQATKLILILLQESAKSNIWHSKSGKLKESIEINLDKKMLFSNSVYAMAQEKGHYATPQNTPKKMFLKFTDGGKDVFMRFTRSKKQPFFFKTISQNKQQILEVFDDAVKDMIRSI